MDLIICTVALVENPSIGTYLLIATVLTAGTAFLLWLGELITAKGVGNGISIIIFAGIVAGFPTTINQIYAQQFQNAGDQLFLRIVTMVLIALAVLAIVVAVIFVQQALRKIPIQYAKRAAVGRTQMGGQSTHLPLKVNAAGVIPVIFAMAFLITPTTIATFFGTNDVTTWIRTTFDYTHPIGMIIICSSYYCIFIFLCLYSG